MGGRLTGGLDMAPRPPNARSAPGNPGRFSKTQQPAYTPSPQTLEAPRETGSPLEDAATGLHPAPNARSAPGNSGRLSKTQQPAYTTRPNARSAPGIRGAPRITDDPRAID